jgi:two-component system sensor histidine kinase MprB
VSFRLRLTVLASLAVAAAIVGTSFVVYFTNRSQLLGQVDSDLRASRNLPPVTDLLSKPSAPKETRGPTPPGKFVVVPNSRTAVRVSIGARRQGHLPPWARAISVPVRFPAPISVRYTTATIAGVRSRVLTLVLPDKIIRISASLHEVDKNLAHLRWLLIWISVGGVGAAAILGALVSRRAVAPLRGLTETTERILQTGDLSQRTGRRGRDEISRLSARLDELLASLELSLRTQRQLVADASHELRTPIATLRANFGLLVDPGALDPGERAELLADVEEELESMTTLVGELVELARGEELDVAPREFRLDEVVKSVVERAAKRAPGCSFRTRLEPSVVVGVPERVERAVANLLDNARKWSPANETVDVAVHDGVVEVRDRGPGIAADDLPLVFNRFYRSAKARGMPGAGLGLAIVKQIADAHGGSVTADRAPDGGAILRLRLS